MRALLDAGAPIDAADDDGRRALHWAVERGAFETVALLLVRRADVNVADNAGATPLHVACGDLPDQRPDGVRACAGLLLGAGADVNARLFESGRTPLHLAALYAGVSRGTALLSQLLQNAKSAAAVDFAGCTPLHIACSPIGQPVLEVVDALLEHGADARAADTRGWQPLHSLAAHQRPTGAGDDDVEALAPIIEALKTRGADVDAVDGDNRTPLMIALAEGHSTAKKALVRCGARVGPPECGRCAVRAGMQRAAVGLAAEAARLQRQQAEWEQERAALARQQAALEQERTAWEQERAALARQQAVLVCAALEVARVVSGGGGSAQPDGDGPAAKRARRGGGC